MMRSHSTEFTVSIGNDLEGVEKLAVIRILFALNASRGQRELSGLANVRDLNDECRKLVQLRNSLSNNRSLIEELIDKEAIDAVLQEVLPYDNAEKCLKQLRVRAKIERGLDDLIGALNSFYKACYLQKRVLPQLNHLRCHEIYTKYMSEIEELYTRTHLDSDSVNKLCHQLKESIESIFNVVWSELRKKETPPTEEENNVYQLYRSLKARIEKLCSRLLMFE
jgi:hypothetical protein